MNYRCCVNSDIQIIKPGYRSTVNMLFIKRNANLLISCVVLVLCANNLFSQHASTKIELADSVYYSDPDKSCKLCMEAEKEAKKNGDLDIVADARLCKARYHLLKADYRRAEKNISLAIERFTKIGSKNRLASAFNLYAIYYERIGQKQKSYDYQNESIRLFRETKNIQGMSNIMNNLANAYVDDNRLSLAKELLDEIEGYKDRMSQSALYFYYQNRGYLQLRSRELQESLKSFSQALQITEDQKMIDSKITILTLMAEVYLELKKINMAENVLMKAEKIAESGSYIFELSEVYAGMNELYLAQGRNDKLAELREKESMLELKMKEQSKLKQTGENNHESDKIIGKHNSHQKNSKVKVTETNKAFYLYIFAAVILLAAFIVVLIKRQKSIKKP